MQQTRIKISNPKVKLSPTFPATILNLNLKIKQTHDEDEQVAFRKINKAKN